MCWMQMVRFLPCKRAGAAMTQYLLSSTAFTRMWGWAHSVNLVNPRAVGNGIPVPVFLENGIHWPTAICRLKVTSGLIWRPLNGWKCLASGMLAVVQRLKAVMVDLSPSWPQMTPEWKPTLLIQKAVNWSPGIGMNQAMWRWTASFAIHLFPITRRALKPCTLVNLIGQILPPYLELAS